MNNIKKNWIKISIFLLAAVLFMSIFIYTNHSVPQVRIGIGEDARQVMEALKRAGYKPIPSGIMTIPTDKTDPSIEEFKSCVFEMNDGTVVRLLFAKRYLDKYEEMELVGIEVGEAGRGYADKKEWFRQARTDQQALDLRR